MTSVLFVCTANRFRSPLAEVAFRDELEKSGNSATCSVGSAGTWAEPGLPAMQDAIQAAAEFGLDISSHRSRLINYELLKEYSLIVVMHSGHKEALSVEFSDLNQKVFLLSEATGGVSFDIPDPYVTGEPPVEVARDIFQLTRTGWMSICQLAKKMKDESCL